ncbi:MAG: thiaminase II [Rhodospirillales bacterium]
MARFRSKLTPKGSLVARLKAACAKDWERYTWHGFVRQLGQGTLPEAAFRRYLIQDYLFLIHFSRAYALAVYKADSLEDMRRDGGVMNMLLNHEMSMHVKFCEGWGIAESRMAAMQEDRACTAYTRFVLDAGQAGDVLDLHTALAPCVVGYGEVAERLMADKATRLKGNPYREWIEMYASDAYRKVAADAVGQLDRLYRRRAGPGRFQPLARLFAAATRLETDFWQMGLDAARPPVPARGRPGDRAAAVLIHRGETR